MPTDPPVTKDAFTRSVAARLQVKHPDLRIVIDGELALSAAGPGNARFYFDLERLWRACAHDEDWNTRVDDYVASSPDWLRPDTSAARAEQLVPMLRPERYLRWLEDQAGSLPQRHTENRPLARPFAAGLQVVLMLDLGNHRRILRAGQLAALGLAEEAAFGHALETLARRAGEGLRIEPVAELPGLFGLQSDDHTAASRLLLGGWNELAAQFGAGVLAVAPSDDVVLFAADRPGNAEVLASIGADALAEAGNPLSAAVLRWTGIRWDGLA